MSQHRRELKGQSYRVFGNGLDSSAHLILSTCPAAVSYSQSIAVSMWLDNGCVISSIISAAAPSHMTQRGTSQHLANLQQVSSSPPLRWVVWLLFALFSKNAMRIWARVSFKVQGCRQYQKVSAWTRIQKCSSSSSATWNVSYCSFTYTFLCLLVCYQSV